MPPSRMPRRALPAAAHDTRSVPSGIAASDQAGDLGGADIQHAEHARPPLATAALVRRRQGEGALAAGVALTRVGQRQRARLCRIGRLGLACQRLADSPRRALARHGFQGIGPGRHVHLKPGAGTLGIGVAIPIGVL